MTRKPAIVAEGEAPAASPNPVLEQQRRIAAGLTAGMPLPEFGDASPAPRVEHTPYEALLYEVLVSAEWKGDRDRIGEALPHQQAIRSIRLLRTVLARLGIRLIPIGRAANQLGPEDFPALVHDQRAASATVLRAGGDPQTLDLGTGARRAATHPPSRGTVYLIRAGEAEDAAAPKPAGSLVRHIAGHMRGRLAVIMGYSAAMNAVALGLSLYTMMVYDILIASRSVDTLILLAAGAGCALFLLRSLGKARARAIAYLAARFDGVVSVRTLASVLNMPLARTEREPIAAQLSRFRRFEIGREFLSGPFASAIFDLPFALVFIVALFAIGGTLALVTASLAATIVAVCALGAPTSAARIGHAAAGKLKADTLLLELTGKLRAIRNGSAEAIWLARYADSLAEYHHARFTHLQHALTLRTVTAGLAGLALVLTLGMGGARVMDGAMSLGALAAAMMLVWKALEPIRVVALSLPRLKQAVTTLGEIDEVARGGDERKLGTPLTLPRRLRGTILVSGAHLTLGARQEAQLVGVNLSVRAGEIVAITGPTGSGKSLLLKLILGLYPRYMGTVRLDGLDLRQLDPAEVRAAIGHAARNPAFFYGTMAANFRLARPDATDDDIAEALAAMGVTLPHPAFPEGLATWISGGARTIPHGLLCRLSIARALIKRPPILMFDDIGTGLDQAGDAAFLAHLDALRGRSTVLLVTARPSHMRAADRVIEMRGGTVAAEGPPEAMVSRLLAHMREAI